MAKSGTIFQSHAKKVDQDVRIGDWFVIFGTKQKIAAATPASDDHRDYKGHYH
jgi:hypothetical protein